MKQIFAFGLACILLFASGCASDSTSPNGGGNSNVHGTMTATVAGAAWSANTVLTAQNNSGMLVITADEVKNGNDKKIQLNLMGVNGPGTFSTGGFTPNSMVYINIPAGTTDPQVIINANEIATSGSVTVTEINSAHVKGTFSFNTAKTVVSNGAFDVNF
jgi:hypothetical protein